MGSNFGYEVITCQFLAKKWISNETKKRVWPNVGWFFFALLLYKHGQGSLEEFIRILLIFHHKKNISLLYGFRYDKRLLNTGLTFLY